MENLEEDLQQMHSVYSYKDWANWLSENPERFEECLYGFTERQMYDMLIDQPILHDYVNAKEYLSKSYVVDLVKENPIFSDWLELYSITTSDWIEILEAQPNLHQICDFDNFESCHWCILICCQEKAIDWIELKKLDLIHQAQIVFTYPHASLSVDLTEFGEDEWFCLFRDFPKKYSCFENDIDWSCITYGAYIIDIIGWFPPLAEKMDLPNLLPQIISITSWKRVLEARPDLVNYCPHPIENLAFWDAMPADGWASYFDWEANMETILKLPEGNFDKYIFRWKPEFICFEASS